MKNTITIKKNYEFKNFFSKGKALRGNYINLYIIETNNSYNKIGIGISKKNGKAHLRNKVKRLIRENYKLLEDNIKVGTNLLFIVKKDIDLKDITFYDIKEDFYNILKKAEVI